VVVVLLHSKPCVLPPSALRAAAVIEAFSPGMRGGRAVAELVLGEIEPFGRLPVSVPRHVGQQPTYYNQVRGQHGQRYADLTQDPQFVFGEGLTYTTVEWSGLTIDGSDVAPGDVVTAEVTLTNTGDRTANELVQVYVTDVVTSVTWAAKELKAFQRVEVPVGESVSARVEVPVSSCTIVDAAGRRVVEPGEFELLVGPSSRDADLQRARFTVHAPSTTRPTLTA
ncbi:MAG TPA: fibronectin type III-like domain-contianing protein, partial [Humibacillus xanthopallidus]|nr:fibronectin type III-like domain-contianing protein [Humibacillus xanthopallidus]